LNLAIVASDGHRTGNAALQAEQEFTQTHPQKSYNFQILPWNVSEAAMEDALPAS
jgi:hypothetical protein